MLFAEFAYKRRIAKAVLVSLGLLLSCLTVLAPITAQDQPHSDARSYFQLARKAYQEKNYASFVDNMKLALALRPTHQTYIYYLARGYALIGNNSEALSLLSHAADMGLIYDLEKESDFDPIKDSAEFKKILRTIENNRKPIVNSEIAFTAREKDLIPEGFAYDSASQTFYLGSVYKRKIVMIDREGRQRDFSKDQDGLWSVMGMKVDAKRRLLWATTTAQPQMSNYRTEEKGRSGIVKYDLTTGRLVKRYTLSNPNQAHWLGDLTINSRGDVFATDSVSPAIYVIDHRKDELDLFVDGKAFVNPQGLAFTPDEKHLLMSDYSLGLFQIDANTKKCIHLSFPTHTTLLGIDGLYRYGNSLIGVQNGINPNRIVRIFMARDFSQIERLEVVEANNPLFNEPTLGAVVNHEFYFIANSQWEAVDQNGQVKAPASLKEPLVLKLRL